MVFLLQDRWNFQQQRRRRQRPQKMPVVQNKLTQNCLAGMKSSTTGLSFPGELYDWHIASVGMHFGRVLAFSDECYKWNYGESKCVWRATDNCGFEIRDCLMHMFFEFLLNSYMHLQCMSLTAAWRRISSILFDGFNLKSICRKLILEQIGHFPYSYSIQITL